LPRYEEIDGISYTTNIKGIVSTNFLNDWVRFITNLSELNMIEMRKNDVVLEIPKPQIIWSK
jgi:hypothetical protein